MKPFEDDTGSASISDLTIENGTTAISLSGSLEIGRDKQGLKHAQALKLAIDQIVEALERTTDLPDHVSALKTPEDVIENPFA